MEKFSTRWIYMAITYFVIAVGLGIFMGASKNHGLMPVHAHLNLLGWVSLAITGFIYHAFPAAGMSRLATLHFWLYNMSLPVMMLALGLLLNGWIGAEPLVGLSSMVVGSGVLVFAVNLFLNVSKPGVQDTAPVVVSPA